MIPRMNSHVPSLALASALLLSGCSGLALDDVLDATGTAGGGTGGELDRETVIAGLKQALEIGTQRTVDRTAVLDGFLGNELIRISIPPELDTMADVLRRIGLRRQVDNLEVSMNRAAEEATGEARRILWAEIRTLTIPNAMSILGGGPSAATDFLFERTSAEIRSEFHPIVVEKMEAIGLARLYANLSEGYHGLSFATPTEVDLDEYVTDRALAGLFTILGEEERKIREDPVARTTELLHRVFG